MLDLDRLTVAERALHTLLFPHGIKPNVKAEGARVSSFDAVWVFGAACFRHPSVGTVPAPVIELLEARGYEPVIEFELYRREVAKLRAERVVRRRRVWRLMILMMIRRAELRAQRERIVALLIAEGERARRAHRRRWLIFPRGIMRATVSARWLATLVVKLIVALVLAVLIYLVGLVVVMMAGGTECGDCPWWGDLFKWPAALAVIGLSFVIVFGLLSGAFRDASTARHK